jgi:hypothetical protein
MIVMRIYSPSNIVQFEFAGTIQSATEIISNWGAEGTALAKTSIYLDFVFLVLYCVAFSLACRVASEFSKNPLLIKTGVMLSWIVWAAGISDAVENMGMLLTLDEINQSTISVSWYFAAIKFSILAIVLLFILASSLTGLIKKMV